MADFPHRISGIAVSAAMPCIIANVEARSIPPSLSMSGTQRNRTSRFSAGVRRTWVGYRYARSRDRNGGDGRR